jgi:HlyD family secretion protein
MRRKWLWALPPALLLAAIGGGIYRGVAGAVSIGAKVPTVPTTTIKRGDLTFTVNTRGELQGGNSEMLTAPMTGENQMAITFLRGPGEVVKAGDVVVEFDTTEQGFRLKEAEADLAEAEQQVAQAQAESDAKEEEDRYAVLQAKAEVRLAELETRRNELLSAIVARQNELALESARDKLAQIEADLGNRKATSQAGIAIQEANRNKAQVKAEVARKNIESMTLRAKSSGYVSVQQNTVGNLMFGMRLPLLHVGDTARPGMAVVQIPDLQNWEMTSRIGELDRGHLAAGQKAEITVVALPGRRFTGAVKDFGGVAGPPWDRYFDCRISIDHPTRDLRPGMSGRIVITTGNLKKVLWAPAQALFESDGRTFIYVREGDGFLPRDVKLVQRSESAVAIEGLPEGAAIALASPDQQSRKTSDTGGALEAIPK